MQIPISAYDPFFSQERQAYCPGGMPYNYEFFQFMEEIKSGAFKDQISNLRQIADKNARAAFKAQNLRAVSISAICQEWRKESNIIAHTGLMGIDVDPDDTEIDDWGALRDAIADRLPVVACALSASGQGVFFVIRVPKDLSLHRDIYSAVAWQFEQLFGLRVDPTGKNPDRLRFTSYDPDCYINYEWESLPEIVPPAEYWKYQAELSSKTLQLRSTGSADSVQVFRNAIQIAESSRPGRDGFLFIDGQKHPYLVALAGHCNACGMSQARCEQLVVRYLGPRTSITEDALLRPVRNVYKTYASAHGKMAPTPRPYIPIRHKRWLLDKVTKSYLRDNLHLYGRTVIYGPSQMTGIVSSRLLVFLMHLYSPKYTWACEPMPGATTLTNEECAECFRPDAKLDKLGEEVIFVDHRFEYPKDWDA